MEPVWMLQVVRNIQELAGVAWSLNLLLGSTVIIALFLFSRRFFYARSSRGFSRFLGLLAFACLALLPVLTVVFSSDSFSLATEVSILEVKTFAASNPLGDGRHWSAVAIAVYLIPSLLLLGRFCLGLIQLWWIKHRLRPCSNPRWHELLANAVAQQGITRTVAVCMSDSVGSPLTFGWLRPVIVMPEGASRWSDEQVIDVLTHELVHIRRLDWLSLIFVYCIASVYWMIPVVWILYARFLDDVEASCDEEVLLAGRDVNDYAQSLVSAARESNHGRQSGHWLGQTMLGRSQLEQRVNYLLENNMMTIKSLKERSVGRGVGVMLGAFVLTTMFSVVDIVAADASDSGKTNGTFYPLNTVEPTYPKAAADEGIEGWVHVKFLVNESGTVDDLEVIESEPAQIFDASALAAARQFRFSQHMVEGHAVKVPNVQYVFRFKLSAESEVDGPETL
jgi:TonB family protein